MSTAIQYSRAEVEEQKADYERQVQQWEKEQSAALERLERERAHFDRSRCALVAFGFLIVIALVGVLFAPAL